MGVLCASPRRCITGWSSGPTPATLAGPLTAHVSDMKILAALLGILLVSSSVAETFSGRLYVGPENESFYPCGNRTGYWFLAPKNVRESLIAEGIKKSAALSEQGVFVALDGKLGRRTKTSDGEFISAYPAFFHIKRVLSVTEVSPNDCHRSQETPSK